MPEFTAGDLLDLTCPCGKTTVKSSTPFVGVGTCHCVECRYLTQGACLEAAIYVNNDSFTHTGELVKWKRPDLEMTNYACDACKCVLYHTTKQHQAIVSCSEIKRHYGYVLKGAMHVHYQERVLDIADDLPKFANLPEMFGGTGEMMQSDGTLMEAPAKETTEEEAEA